MTTSKKSTRSQFQKKRTQDEVICRCNEVTRNTIEDAIRNGCKTLNEIFDSTSAGVGPCGGSCRRKLAPMLRHFQETGTFPERIIEDPKSINTDNSCTSESTGSTSPCAQCTQGPNCSLNPECKEHSAKE